MSGKWEFRLAERRDAEAFAIWVAKNGQIDARDIEFGLKKNNPTVIYFVVCKDDVPVTFAPLFCSMTLAHLAFDPESDGRDRLRALQMMIDGVAAFAVQFGVREITTLTREEYPVGAWALKHGFEKDSRELFRLDLNRLMGAEKETVGA